MIWNVWFNLLQLLISPHIWQPFMTVKKTTMPEQVPSFIFDWHVSVVDIDFWKFLWIYCTGHARMKRNDWANGVVGKAAITCGLCLRGSDMLRSLRHYLCAQSQGHHIINQQEERGMEEEALRVIFLESTREGHHRWDGHWNSSRASLGKLQRDRMECFYMGFSEHVDTILNWTELSWTEYLIVFYICVSQVNSGFCIFVSQVNSGFCICVSQVNSSFCIFVSQVNSGFCICVSQVNSGFCICVSQVNSGFCICVSQVNSGFCIFVSQVNSGFCICVSQVNSSFCIFVSQVNSGFCICVSQVNSGFCICVSQVNSGFCICVSQVNSGFCICVSQVNSGFCICASQVNSGFCICVSQVNSGTRTDRSKNSRRQQRPRPKLQHQQQLQQQQSQGLQQLAGEGLLLVAVPHLPLLPEGGVLLHQLPGEVSGLHSQIQSIVCD